jgi:hypothetical protein
MKLMIVQRRDVENYLAFGPLVAHFSYFFRNAKQGPNITIYKHKSLNL